MAENLFLDSNIFLSFYALSSADIHQLEQLESVVRNGHIRLFVNSQLENEVERNREGTIYKSLDTFRHDSFKWHAPSFVRSMGKFEELQGELKEANKRHAVLLDEVAELVRKRDLAADKLISRLLLNADVKDITSEQFDAAMKRFRNGNPPGKKKVTLGDELNWEFLLASVPANEDLHVVSQDSDYAAPDDRNKANAFLVREWERRKHSNLHFYRELSDFFKEHVKNIKLEDQKKLSTLISDLGGSDSFASTHAIIAKFPEDPDFNDAQVSELMNIAENNSQVGWIKDDADVAAFYRPIEERFLKIKDGE